MTGDERLDYLIRCLENRRVRLREREPAVLVVDLDDIMAISRHLYTEAEKLRQQVQRRVQV